ncbi:MAG: hypothetical protein LQ343_003970 [Gyalolechia ehrenbergii]|nr:MAG: hypothetical protein LQ343_003970 [Gyalolechia ehrenbergii]
MIPNTSQDSNGSSNSSYSQRSSNTYASSPSTTDAYSPTGYQSSYPTSSTTRTHYPILAPSRPLPPPPTPSQPPVSSSSEKKSKSSKPTPYICVYRGCTRQFARSFDLDRHMKTHFPNAIQKLDCPKGAQGSFCRRVGEKGFTRKDHLDEHLRKVHLVDLPKSARGTRG